MFRGGFLVLDYFGDADLLDLARGRPLRALSLSRDLGRPRTIAALARAALGQDWTAFAYASGLENRPRLLRLLEERGDILGNDARAVARVRDPWVLFPFLEREGIPHAPVEAARIAPVEAGGVGPAGRRERWLFKPIRAGGGMRVRFAAPGERRPRGFYAQGYVEGTPGSAAFVAGGGRATVLGVTRLLPGFADLGGSGFRYGGNIAGPPADLLDAPALATLSRAAEAIARRFGLRGLGGIDYVAGDDGTPRLVEVNPRYTASMELFEDLSAVCLFDLHLRAIKGGDLPAGPLPVDRYEAKGIVYATTKSRWVGPGAVTGAEVRDRPAPGESFDAGQPVCTLVVTGRSADACRRALVGAAARLRSEGVLVEEGGPRVEGGLPETAAGAPVLT